MPRVSIITPAYNAARYLSAAIDSVLGQTYTDWELIIVDDGSTDGTRSLVHARLPSTGDRIRYLYQPNRGQPAARNAGIQVAKGEFIAILDADDMWLPTRLERGVSVMDRSPNAGLVHSRVARIDVHGNIVSHLEFPRKYQAGRIAVDIYTRRANILSPTVLFRKQCLEEVGTFDQMMRATEDRDLWFRIAGRYEIAYINEILAYSRLTPGSMGSDSDRNLKWQLFFVRKHYQKYACGRAALLRALGQIYREQGDNCFSHGLLKKSIGHYSRSVYYNPLNLKNVYMLLRASTQQLLTRPQS
jgi:glycosyltransferase involved in cell wall biosynthesis